MLFCRMLLFDFQDSPRRKKEDNSIIKQLLFPEKNGAKTLSKSFSERFSLKIAFITTKWILHIVLKTYPFYLSRPYFFLYAHFPSYTSLLPRQNLNPYVINSFLQFHSWPLPLFTCSFFPTFSIVGACWIKTDIKLTRFH